MFDELSPTSANASETLAKALGLAAAAVQTTLAGRAAEMAAVFGASEALDALAAGWLADGPDLNGITVVDPAVLEGADGAYAAEGDRILLSAALFGGAYSMARIVDVIVEELGHRIDARVNAQDSPGDEGALFAAVVRGEAAGSSTADDHRQIVLDGEVLDAETAVSVSDSGGYEGSHRILTLESPGGGTITFSYEMYGIPDRMVIRYEGKNILDTGFVSYSRTGKIELPSGTSDKLEVLIITDDAGTAWYYTVSVEGCAEIAPFKIESLGAAFTQNKTTGKCETNATVLIGRTDGVAAMLRAAGAAAAYDRNGLTIEGSTVRAEIGGEKRSLFYGDFNISFATGTGTIKQVKPGGFRMANMEVEFTTIAVLSSKLAFGVNFVLPEEASGANVDTVSLGAAGLVIDASGASARLGMKVSLPDPEKFKLGGVVEVEAKNISVEYRGAEDAVRVQAEVKFEIETKAGSGGASGATQRSVTANFAGENYIQVNSDGDVTVVGSLKVATAWKFGGWSLNEIELTLNTTSKEIGGTAVIGTPFGVKFGDEGISAKPSMEFTYDPIQLDAVGLTIDNINKPIPAYPLFFFQMIGGKVDNFAASNSKAIEVTASVGATLGPQINGTSLARAELEAKITSQSFTATGKLDVLTANFHFEWGTFKKDLGTFTLIKQSGAHELNWKEGKYTFTGSTNVLDGFLNLNTKTTYDKDFNFGTSGKGTLGIPTFVPGYGGTTLTNANYAISFTNDSDYSNDYIAGWGQVTIRKLGLEIDATVGLRVNFDGTATRIGGDNIPTTSSWYISPGREWIMLTALWDNESPGTTVRVIAPDGTVFEEADFEANGIAVVDELSDGFTRTVVIAAPAEGTWDLEVTDTAGLGTVHYEAQGETTPTTMEFTTEPVILADGSARFFYEVDSPAPVVTIRFYYDDDLTDLDGVFAGSVSVTSGAGQFDWDGALAVPDDYFLYALVDDGSGVIYTAQSGHSVAAGSEADLDIGIRTEGNLQQIEGAAEVRYVVTVTNRSADTARAVDVLFNVTDGITVKGASRTLGSTGLADYLIALGDIAGGATVSFTVDAETAAALTNPETHAADVYVLAPGYDPNANNDTAVVQFVTLPEAEKTVAIKAEVIDLPTDPVVMKDSFSFTVRITNTGSQMATGVTLLQSLDNVTGVTFPGHSSSWTAAGYRVNLPNLAAGASAEVEVQATAAAAGSVRGLTQVTSNEADSNVIDNEVLTALSIDGITPDTADVSLLLSGGTPDGSGVTKLNVAVTNAGPGIASNVQVKVDLPAGVTVSASQTVQGSYDSATGIWSLGNMRDLLTRTLVLTLAGNVPGTATAEVIAVDEVDPDSMPNNQAPGEDDQDSLEILFAGTLLARDDGFALTGGHAKLTGVVTLDNGNGPDLLLPADPGAVTEINGTAIGTDPITLASGAILTMEDDGTFSYDGSAVFGELAFGETDTDSFTYTYVSDSGLETTATVTVTAQGGLNGPAAGQQIVLDAGGITEDLLAKMAASDVLVLTGDTTASDLEFTRDGASILISGAFGSVTVAGPFGSGGMLASDLGTGTNARVSISFVDEAPELVELTAVASTAINGIVAEDYLTGNGAKGYTAEFQGSTAKLASAVGSYRIAADGTISDVQMLFSNSKTAVAGSQAALGVLDDGEVLGFFIVAGGAAKISALGADTFEFRSTDGTAANAAGAAPVLFHNGTAVSGVTVFHGIDALNPTGARQALSGVADGQDGLTIAFEDLLRSGSSDHDFNDIVIRVFVNDLPI